MLEGRHDVGEQVDALVLSPIEAPPPDPIAPAVPKDDCARAQLDWRKGYALFNAAMDGDGKPDDAKLRGARRQYELAVEACPTYAAAHNSLWEQLGKRLSNADVDNLRRYFYKE